MAKIVITSGGTREAIDKVRSITNSSSGKLGAQIANEFAARAHRDEIIYIHSKGAVLPKSSPKIRCIEIVSTADLEREVMALSGEDVKIFVHSMAVADYTVKRVVDFEKFKTLLCEKKNVDEYDVEDFIKEATIKNTSKMSSNIKSPAIFLTKTPKVISIVKKLFPRTFLVGFKLLENVSEDELFDVGFDLLRKNRCNLVLANDLAEIRKGNHKGIIIFPEKSYIEANGKQEIAEKIVHISLVRSKDLHPHSEKKGEKLPEDMMYLQVKFRSMKYVGQKMYEMGLLPEVVNHERTDKIGTYGNISNRITENSFLITGRNVHKGRLDWKDVCYVENVAKVEENPSVYANVEYHGEYKPSIDSAIHGHIYKAFPNLNSIIHIHTDRVFLGYEYIDGMYPCGCKNECDQIMLALGRCQREDVKVVQMKKHGLIVVGKSLEDCYLEILRLFEREVYIDYGAKEILNNEAMKHIKEVGAEELVTKSGKLYPLCINKEQVGVVWEETKGRDIHFAIYANAVVSRKGYGIVRKYLALRFPRRYYLHTMKDCNIAEFYKEKYGFRDFDIKEDYIILAKDLG